MLRIEINHWKLVELAKEFPTTYEALRAFATDENGVLPPLEEMAAGKGFGNFAGYCNDVHKLPGEVLNRCTFKPIRSLKLFPENGESISGSDMKSAMAMYQVHLPGHELLKIREVEVREDSCTDEISRYLAEGWRIVAVIPRAGQRRPDYVLGKT